MQPNVCNSTILSCIAECANCEGVYGRRFNFDQNTIDQLSPRKTSGWFVPNLAIPLERRLPQLRILWPMHVMCCPCSRLRISGIGFMLKNSVTRPLAYVERHPLMSPEDVNVKFLANFFKPHRRFTAIQKIKLVKTVHHIQRNSAIQL